MVWRGAWVGANGLFYKEAGAPVRKSTAVDADMAGDLAPMLNSSERYTQNTPAQETLHGLKQSMHAAGGGGAEGWGEVERHA